MDAIGTGWDTRETAGSPASGRPGSERDLILAALAQADRAAGSDHPGADENRLPVSLPRDYFQGYDVKREIHRGGQGVVYKAIQRSTRQAVAIKLMHGGAAHGSAGRARFEREVQVLGKLNHPGIVKVHDSGTTSDGGLYYVMDYVAGKPLDVVIREWRVEAERVRRGSTTTRSSSRSSVLGSGVLRTRLEMIAKVCEGVNASHLKGVIHRDLKPANIRLDARGEPIVVDFGLAKVSSAEEAASAGQMTTTGQFIGSMPWSSPEQAEGAHDSVDTRSDVYSLGVILYQVVTGGRFPYVVAGTMREVMHNILHAEPERPSLIDRGINDEVETIILKALSKSAERRYQTAGELARDIRRYLAGEPIEAKRDSGWYLISKAMRKHRVPAGFVVAIAVLTVGFTIALAGMYAEADTLRDKAEARAQAAQLAERQAEAERARAQANFDSVRDLARIFMFDFHDEIENLRGATRARALVVEKATEYLDRLQRQVDTDPAPDLELHRELARALDRLGELQAGFAEANEGDTTRAEAAFARSRSIREALIEREPGHAGLWLDSGDGALSRARIEQRRGAFYDAVSTGLEALASLERAADLGASTLAVSRSRARAFELLGDLHHRLARAANDRDSADAMLEAAIAWYERAGSWWGQDPGGGDTDPSIAGLMIATRLASSVNERANWARREAASDPTQRAGLLAESEREARRALALAFETSAGFEKLRHERPADRDATNGLVISRMEEGLVWETLAAIASLRDDEQGRAGALAEALSIYQSAYHASRTLARDEADLDAQRSHGLTMNKLGNALREQGRLDEAELLYEELVEHRRAVLRADPVARHERDLALVLGKRAQIDQIRAGLVEGEQRSGLYRSALAGYGEALEIFRSLRDRGVPMEREIAVTERVIRRVESDLRSNG